MTFLVATAVVVPIVFVTIGPQKRPYLDVILKDGTTITAKNPPVEYERPLVVVTTFRKLPGGKSEAIPDGPSYGIRRVRDAEGNDIPWENVLRIDRDNQGDLIATLRSGSKTTLRSGGTMMTKGPICAMDDIQSLTVRLERDWEDW